MAEKEHLTDKNYETDETHFTVFVETAEFFIGALGLQNWQVAYKHLDDPDLQDSRAFINTNVRDGQQATITLSKSWQHDEPTMHKVMLAAYHEVKHLLMATMYNVALYDELMPDMRDRAYRRAEHEVIRRMENVVFPLFTERLNEHLRERLDWFDPCGK